MDPGGATPSESAVSGHVMTGKDDAVLLRKYQLKDYQSLFDLVYEAKTESWTTAYWRTMNTSKRLALTLRMAVLTMSLRLTFPWPLISVLFYEILVMAAIYLTLWYDTW